MLQIHEQLERPFDSPSGQDDTEEMGEGEKAIVRELCKVSHYELLVTGVHVSIQHL